MTRSVAKFLASYPGRPLVVCSHRRSGTHLTIDLLRKQIAECRCWKWPGQPLSLLYLSIESIDNPSAPTPTSSSAGVGVLRKTRAPIFKTHLTYEQLRDRAHAFGHPVSEPWVSWVLDRGQFCYAYRDGRQVLSSTFQFRRSGRQASFGDDWRDFLRRPGKDGLTPARAWAQHVRSGIAIPSVFTMKWEETRSNPREQLENLTKALRLTPRYVEPLLPQSRSTGTRSRIAGRLLAVPESTAVLTKQRPPRWQELFTQEDRILFNSETQSLLQELGYESDDSWIGTA